MIWGALDAYACRVFAIDASQVEKQERGRGRAALESSTGLQQVLEGTLSGPEKKQITGRSQKSQGVSPHYIGRYRFRRYLNERIPVLTSSWGTHLGRRLPLRSWAFLLRLFRGSKQAPISQAERAKLIAAFVRRRPDVLEHFEQEVARTKALRELLRSSYELTRSGDPQTYTERLRNALCTSVEAEGAIGMIYPHSLVTSDGTGPYRGAAFPKHRVIVDFAINANGWVFADVHPQYMVVALTRSRGDEIVSTGGPVSSLQAWEAAVDNRIDWTLDELRAIGWPRTSVNGKFSLCRVIQEDPCSNGQPFRVAVDGTNFRPWTDFHGTNDRKAGILKEDGKGWPAYKGDNYDLWVPEQGEPPFTVDPKQGLAELQRRRLRSEVWRGFSPAALHDPNTLPPNQCHVLFRDITNRLNNRTVIGCLVPPRRFAINFDPRAAMRKWRLSRACTAPWNNVFNRI